MSVSYILFCKQRQHVKVVNLVLDVVRNGEYPDVSSSNALAEMWGSYIITELLVVPNSVEVLFQVLGVSVGHVIGKVDALVLLLNNVDEWQSVVDPFTTDAGLIEVVVLVALEKPYVSGDVWVYVPAFLRLTVGWIVFILYPWKHTALVETLCPMKISYVHFYLGPRFEVFGDDLEVVPVHQSILIVGVEFKV